MNRSQPSVLLDTTALHAFDAALFVWTTSSPGDPDVDDSDNAVFAGEGTLLLASARPDHTPRLMIATGSAEPADLPAPWAEVDLVADLMLEVEGPEIRALDGNAGALVSVQWPSPDGIYRARVYRVGAEALLPMDDAELDATAGVEQWLLLFTPAAGSQQESQPDPESLRCVCRHSRG